METRRLGNSDLDITLIGLGAWAMGGADWAFGWGPQDDDNSIAAIHRALDLGINWIDTAAFYGYGHSEEVVGKAIKGRQRPYIFTKCQRRWDENGQPYDSLREIRQEVEASLKRLDVDVIDLYQIHWPRPDEDIELGWSTMADLQREGKVRHIGVSNFNVAQMQRAQAIAPITSLQPPYSLIVRDIEDEILPFCRANNIGVIAYAPMASGMLTGTMSRDRAESLPESDWRSRNPRFQEPQLSRNLALVELMYEIGEPHAASPAEIAIAWVLKHPAVTAAISGFRTPDQVDGVLGGASVELSEMDVQRLDSFLAENA
jgi:aryl-alcohol dehydrogenase-like predicted oxidoreductase